MNVGNGNFIVKFDIAEDKERVIEGGPWMIQDHYLAVKHWSLEFNPFEQCFGKTMVWIRLSGLNLMYYHESAIQTIVVGIGHPVKVNMTTKSLD